MKVKACSSVMQHGGSILPPAYHAPDVSNGGRAGRVTFQSLVCPAVLQRQGPIRAISQPLQPRYSVQADLSEQEKCTEYWSSSH